MRQEQQIRLMNFAIQRWLIFFWGRIVSICTTFSLYKTALIASQATKQWFFWEKSFRAILSLKRSVHLVTVFLWFNFWNLFLCNRIKNEVYANTPESKSYWRHISRLIYGEFHKKDLVANYLSDTVFDYYWHIILFTENITLSHWH